MIAATQSNHPLAASTQPSPAVSPLVEARARIRQAGMRITRPRIAIIESLLRHAGPISIERIHQDLGPTMCDLVTVYRCLAAFESLDMVRRSYLHNGTCLYELTLGSTRHYHIVCKSCGNTERVDYFSVEGMEGIVKERGYIHVSHIVEFFGICPACQQARQARGTSVTVPAEKRI
ncbi:MAG: Fur family transcriptional regulator [Lacunisphaera sp.]|nr:Fur family transcriptional regulator [Lacunisphaera sp.]